MASPNLIATIVIRVGNYNDQTVEEAKENLKLDLSTRFPMNYEVVNVTVEEEL